MYVDDLLKSVDLTDEAQTIYEESKLLSADSGFNFNEVVIQQ